jgi:hypothetical protein
MGAVGAARITECLFETGKLLIVQRVGDDNSCCRMLMRHSFQGLIDASKMTLTQRPRCSMGKTKAKKPDNGLLPANHPPIDFKPDKGEHARNFAKCFFCFVVETQERQERLHKRRRRAGEAPNELETSASCR